MSTAVCFELCQVNLAPEYQDDLVSIGIFFKKWANPHLFLIYFRLFQTQITIITGNKSEKLSIQYTVPGFELTTFGT